MNDKQKVMTASGINELAGIWLIIFALFFSISATVSTTILITGIIVAILALIRLFFPLSSAWASWINVLLGIWLFLTPLFYFGIDPGTTLNNLIIGVIVAAMGVWSAMAARHGHKHHTEHR